MSIDLFAPIARPAGQPQRERAAVRREAETAERELEDVKRIVAGGIRFEEGAEHDLARAGATSARRVRIHGATHRRRVFSGPRRWASTPIISRATEAAS